MSIHIFMNSNNDVDNRLTIKLRRDVKILIEILGGREFMRMAEWFRILVTQEWGCCRSKKNFFNDASITHSRD